jgi:hypothetical protein
MQAASIVRTIEAEIANYPGVAFDFQNGGKHDRLVFRKGEDSRFLTIPKTPSDWRAGANAMRDFRKTMRELGAKRLEEARPARRQVRRSKGFPATLTLTDKLVVLHIPKKSKLLSRFMTKGCKAAAHWQFELRASPDLSAPPMLAVRKVELPEGKKVQIGIVSGFHVSGAWRLTMGRSAFPVLSAKAESIPPTGLTVYEDKGDELVFKLPPGTIPTGFTKAPPQVVEFATPDERREYYDAKAEQPVERRQPQPAEARPAAEPARDQTLTLAFPKQTVSVEQAIAILNKAKTRLGNNLRFTIEEGGWISAIHRIGK